MRKKPFKKRGALYKLVGSVVILASFTTQNFFYELWRAESDSLFAATQIRQLIEKGALINETSFFVLSGLSIQPKLPDQAAVATDKIQQYARKLALSEEMRMFSLASLGDDEKTRYLTALHAEVEKVKDYPTAAAFTSFVNANALKFSQDSYNELESIERRRWMAKWIYLLLYFVGAAVLVRGQWFEWRGVDE